MTALMSILEELTEQMEETNGVELERGALLRSLLGSRIKKEYRREHREEMIEKFLTLSGTACFDLLQQKVQAEIEKSQGEQLNKLAKVIAASGVQRWTTAVEVLQKKEEFKDQVYREFAQTRRNN